MSFPPQLHNFDELGNRNGDLRRLQPQQIRLARNVDGNVRNIDLHKLHFARHSSQDGRRQGLQVRDRCVASGRIAAESWIGAVTDRSEHMEEDDAETRALPEWVRLE